MGCVSSRPEVDDGSSESHHASTPSPSGSDSRRHARAAGFETGAVPSEDLSYESYDADSAAVRRSSEGRTIDHSALGSILMDADARTPRIVPGSLARWRALRARPLNVARDRPPGNETPISAHPSAASDGSAASSSEAADSDACTAASISTPAVSWR